MLEASQAVVVSAEREGERDAVLSRRPAQSSCWLKSVSVRLVGQSRPRARGGRKGSHVQPHVTSRTLPPHLLSSHDRPTISLKLNLEMVREHHGCGGGGHH